MRQDFRLPVRAELLRRIDGIAAERGHFSAARLHAAVDHIRFIAHAHHLDTIESQAEILQSAVSLHGLDAVLMSYLDGMHQAVLSDPALRPS
ncbi:MAG: hypothetical protein ABW164_10820 [Sphingobium sp.]